MHLRAERRGAVLVLQNLHFLAECAIGGSGRQVQNRGSKFAVKAADAFPRVFYPQILRSSWPGERTIRVCPPQKKSWNHSRFQDSFYFDGYI